MTHVPSVRTCSDSKMDAVIRDPTCIKGKYISSVLEKHSGHVADTRADLKHAAEFIHSNTVKQERNQSQMKRLLDAGSCQTWNMNVTDANARYCAALYRAHLATPRNRTGDLIRLGFGRWGWYVGPYAVEWAVA